MEPGPREGWDHLDVVTDAANHLMRQRWEIISMIEHMRFDDPDREGLFDMWDQADKRFDDLRFQGRIYR